MNLTKNCLYFIIRIIYLDKIIHGYMINKMIKHIQKCLQCPGDCIKAILVAAVIQPPYHIYYYYYHLS